MAQTELAKLQQATSGTRLGVSQDACGSAATNLQAEFEEPEEYQEMRAACQKARREIIQLQGALTGKDAQFELYKGQLEK